jgi:hypothetical protein
MHKDDVPGYMYDEVYRFIKNNPTIVDNIKMKYMVTSDMYKLSGLAKELIKMAIEADNLNDKGEPPMYSTFGHKQN